MSEKRKPNFRGLAVIEAVIIFVLAAVLVWEEFIKDDSGSKSSDSRTVAVNADIDDDPQVRTRAVIEKEETYYQLVGKKILMHNDTYGEIYLPVFEDVPASEVDTNAVVTRNGYSFYKKGTEVTSLTGIDVSEHQGDIDWEKVRAAGIEFAMIRIGYRSYGKGEITFDTKYKENIEGAAKAGLKVGVYFFSQAVSTDEAAEEADAVLDAIEGYDISYPVVYDWEIIYDDSARTDDVSVEMLADNCIEFCERVKSAGYSPMIYQNKNTAMYKLDVQRLKDYDFWLAEYSDKPSYYYDYKMWQYSSKGTVPGVNTEVDLDLSFTDYSAQ